MKNQIKILIRGVNWLGDAVMSTPAVRGVRLLYPQSHITLLVNPLVAELFKTEPAVDEIIIFDKKGEHQGIVGFFRLVKQLGARRFNMAILLQNAIEAALITFFAGIPVRVGFDKEMRGALLTRKCRPSQEILDKHQVYYYLEILQLLEKRELPYTPTLKVDEKEACRAETVLSEMQSTLGHNGIIVGINPGSTYGSAKQWGAEKFAQVADGLIKNRDARVLIFGGPNEKDISDKVSGLMSEEGLNLGGATTVRELMALISRCNLFITNDTGPMHIAAAFGVPLVAVFGSTDTKTTSPIGTRNLLIKKDIACAPCLKRECPTDHKCMESISAEQVCDDIENFIDNTM